jgi:type VI secretion system secreted protein VgrG
MKAATFTRAPRPLEIITPLGKDTLFLVGFAGQEGISQLFSFQLDLLAENRRVIAFDKLLAQKVTIRLALGGGKNRYFNGIISRFSQGRIGAGILAVDAAGPVPHFPAPDRPRHPE